jgi:hypothetical protein
VELVMAGFCGEAAGDVMIKFCDWINYRSLEIDRRKVAGQSIVVIYGNTQTMSTDSGRPENERRRPLRQ